MKKVAITDYAFDEIDIEKGILEPQGYAVVGQKSGKDPAALAARVGDADAVITQFAPVNAAIVARWRRPRSSSATASAWTTWT